MTIETPRAVVLSNAKKVNLDVILHISVGCVKIRLQTKYKLPVLLGSANKSNTGGLGQTNNLVTPNSKIMACDNALDLRAIEYNFAHSS